MFKKLLSLYAIFFKMGMVNFGGGYAMLPLLQKELAEKKKWTTEEELADYYAIGQCTPGAIAVNVSTFIGNKVAGVLGGIIATLGFVSPAFIVILIIATVLNKFSSYPVVINALAGIRVCVFILILSAIVKLAKKSIVDVFTLILALAVTILAIFTPIPLWSYVIFAAFYGILICSIKQKQMEKKEKEKLASNSNGNEDSINKEFIEKEGNDLSKEYSEYTDNSLDSNNTSSEKKDGEE